MIIFQDCLQDRFNRKVLPLIHFSWPIPTPPNSNDIYWFQEIWHLMPPTPSLPFSCMYISSSIKHLVAQGQKPGSVGNHYANGPVLTIYLPRGPFLGTQGRLIDFSSWESNDQTFRDFEIRPWEASEAEAQPRKPELLSRIMPD